jgi:hypothetical protein
MRVRSVATLPRVAALPLVADDVASARLRAVIPDDVPCSVWAAVCAAVDGVTRARSAWSVRPLSPARGRLVMAERNGLSSRRGATRGDAVVDGLTDEVRSCAEPPVDGFCEAPVG